VPGLELPASTFGTPGDTAKVIPLVHRGEHIGQMVLDPGPDREPFGIRDQRLLEGLAQQVGATAHSLLLTVNLQRSLERTVTVLEEERRRVRRDIHDGLGPTLASAAMRLDLLRELLHTQPDTADRVLRSVSEAQHQALVDIRRLIENLRPTILDHLGLAKALSEQVERVRGPVAVDLSGADDLGPLPAAVEVAVYRIVSEALTNVVRHAQASTCVIRIWRDTEVHVEIRDDGRGLPTAYHSGVGLTSIRERCAELGGAAQIASAPGGGTLVRCRIPVPARPLGPPS
jgi:signal transduction histidine kinase